MKRRLTFSTAATLDFQKLMKENLKLAKKVFELVESIDDTPYEGLGKPEPLKYGLKGSWSRRISDVHRLVYSVTEEE